MSGIMERLNGVATIEEIEAEQTKLREQIVTIQNELDALEVYRRVLVTARDGKPQRKPRRPRQQKAEKAAEAILETIPAGQPAAVAPVHQILKDDGRRNIADRCVNALEQFSGLTVAELSRALKIPYGNVQKALMQDTRFTSSDGKWWVKRKG